MSEILSTIDWRVMAVTILLSVLIQLPVHWRLYRAQGENERLRNKIALLRTVYFRRNGGSGDR